MIIFEPAFNYLRLSMFFSATIGLFCRKGFTRQYLSRMCRSWMCFLFSGLMSNFYKNINNTNSITYPLKFSHTWLGVDICSILGLWNLVTLSVKTAETLRNTQRPDGVTYKSFALFIFPKLIKKNYLKNIMYHENHK